ncbi:hypothetical protein QUF95_18865 [Paenibacillus silvae]|nr:hypothetical protein [Paenibacillus silvae]MDM5279462.1 hypothetical protein [Paenibacillus silvae]MDM5279463.1 hypothetical protein [Paenibacillus silvae]
MCEFGIRFPPPGAVKKEIGGQGEHQGPAVRERPLCYASVMGHQQ